MDENGKLVSNEEIVLVKDNSFLEEVTKNFLEDARSSSAGKNTFTVPVAQLSTLGAGISTLIPALNTVTQTTTVATGGLYRVVNAGAGDFLKMAKDGTSWGALKTADGASKMAKFQEAGSLSATTQSTAAINPATMMMSVALFSIEQELGKIEEMQKQILTFLEIEKESEIEADVETLMGIARNYKLSWDNEYFVSSNHKLVLDIQRAARKNMNAYQKKVEEAIEKKQLLVAQANVKQSFNNLEKKFKYYRLSLYIFSLASLMEVMLCGNFKEQYIAGIKNEISKLTDAYRSLFEKSSLYLEKMGKTAIDTSVLKGIGEAGQTVGKFIGNIPLIKEGPVDEFLQDKGVILKQNAIEMKKEMVHQFSEISNPETTAFVDIMDDLIQIYNHTEQICFDDKQIYLVAN